MSDIKVTKPWIPVGHPKYRWTSGADVQALWRKYGWAPPSEKMTPPPVEQKEEPSWIGVVRRVK
jgi:hypothetical protein